MDGAEERPRVLVVCTANVCRSPLAQVHLRSHFDAVGAPALVRSAGFLEGGHPADPSAVRVASERGLDLSGHRSLALTPNIARSADLVLTMTGDHVRELLLIDPYGLPRAFPLRSFLRLANGVGPRSAQETFADWIARIARRRQSTELFSDQEDIADPFGQSLGTFRKTSVLLNRLAFQVASLSYPRCGETAT